MRQPGSRSKAHPDRKSKAKPQREKSHTSENSHKPEPPAAISRFPIPALDDMPEDIRARILAVQEKAGFVPNVFLALAHRPEEFRAFFAHHDALMERRGGLSAAQREMIVVATSAANQCHYCVIAHGAILRIRAKQPLLADQIAVNYRKADIPAADRLILDFALKVAGAAATIEDADLRLLREAGFTEDDIWDIGAIAAFFAQSNRLANLADIRPNSEFYTMGRNPRGESG
ncbi:MAG: peroxidase-related enzyme [Pseudomonadales bacterium]